MDLADREARFECYLFRDVGRGLAVQGYQWDQEDQELNSEVCRTPVEVGQKQGTMLCSLTETWLLNERWKTPINRRSRSQWEQVEAWA